MYSDLLMEIMMVNMYWKFKSNISYGSEKK